MPKVHDEKTDEEQAAENTRRQPRESATPHLMGQMRDLDDNLAALSSIAQQSARR